jgi:molecular chaperone DnaK
LDEKVDSGTRAEVEQTIASLKREIEGENITEIKRLTETLTQIAHKLAASAYQQASPQGQAYESAAGGAYNSAAGSASNADEEVVDAEYEEVN